MERLAAHLIALLALFVGQNGKTESPRALLERAAYVEEHERDFEKAVALYQQAEAAARTAHDPHTEREAAAGRQRAEARRDGAPARPDATQDAAVDNRVGNLLDKLSKFNPLIGGNDESMATFSALQDDLVVYGAAAVPRLEALLEPRMVEIGEYRVTMDTRMAARLLATLQVEAASEALGRGLQSKDPLIRRAIAQALNNTRHRALLEQAARDPVDQVRSVAIGLLLRRTDSSLQPLAEEEARAGDYQACQWLAQQNPQRLLELMAESAQARLAGWDPLIQSDLPLSRENVDRLLQMAREGSDDQARGTPIYALEQFFANRWKQSPPDLKLQVQERMLAEPRRYPKDKVAALLGVVGDIRAFEYLSRALMAESAETEYFKLLLRRSRDIVVRLSARDFDALARLYRELPDPTGNSEWHNAVWRRLIDLAGGVSMETLLTGLEGLDAAKRTKYLWVVHSWLQSQPFVQSPTIVPGTLDSAMIPVLRELLDSTEVRLQSVGIWGLAHAGDIDSLPRILAFNNNDPQLSAADPIRALVRQDPDKAARVVLAAIERGEIPANKIRVFDNDPARALALFHECWSRLTDERSRDQLLDVLVLDIWGREADGVILEHWQELGHWRFEAIKRFGASLYEPAMPILGPALEDPDMEIRRVAREAFRAFKEQREALEEYAAWTLGDREARAQVEDLIGLLASPERNVVLGAVKALGAVRGRAALPTLVRLLERKDPELEAAILKTIEAIGQ